MNGTNAGIAKMLAHQAYESAGSSRDIGESLGAQTLAIVALTHAVLALGEPPSTEATP